MTTMPALERFVGSSLLLGQVERIDDSGCAYVTVPGWHAARRACSTVQVGTAQSALGEPVLLYVDPDPSVEPVIVGLVRAALVAGDEQGVAGMAAAGDAIRDAAVYADGKRLALDAQREIVLTCGHSSIRLESNGKITIKGKNVVSRAASCNSIKGAAVKIN